MNIHTEQWESLGAFLAHLESSGSQTLGLNSSLERDGWGGDASLPTFLEQCRTLSRDDMRDRAGDIDRLAEQLTGDLPAGVTQRRQPVWGRSGASVNVHKVLRGDLGHAWRRTVRQAVRQDGAGDLVLILPSVVHSGVSHEQIQWSAVATLALADYARRTGRRVELWSVGFMTRIYGVGESYVWSLPLVRAGQSWDATAVALATYPEWLRRLGFRAVEMTQTPTRTVQMGYGWQMNAGGLLEWVRGTWAPANGLHPASVVLGCTQEDGVRSERAASRWVQGHIDRLNAAA